LIQVSQKLIQVFEVIKINILSDPFENMILAVPRSGGAPGDGARVGFRKLRTMSPVKRLASLPGMLSQSPARPDKMSQDRALSL